jgi:dTDP-4-amino-4,6-dideoxygalactose transaminase
MNSSIISIEKPVIFSEDSKMDKSISRRTLLLGGAAGIAGTSTLSGLALGMVKNAETPALLGGTPVRAKGLRDEWPVYDASDIRMLLDSFYSNKWCSLGADRCVEFEEKWAQLNGVPYCVLTTNGTSALLSSLMALGVGPGDEVITTPYTYAASYGVIFALNALGVFVDTDPETQKIDADLIEDRITEHTRAILPVHIGGGAADMDKIMSISQKYDIPVVEDACQAWLGEWRGKKLGTLGDTGCFSFNYYKNICSGEGGAILGSNSELMDICDSITNDGRAARRKRSAARAEPTEPNVGGHPYPGLNFRLTEIQAAILLGQLQRIEDHQVIRNENFDYLDSLLEEVPGIGPVEKYPGQTKHGCHLYMMSYDKKHFSGLHKSQFAEAVRAEGIPVSGGYGKSNLSGQVERHLNSRSFRSVFSKERLERYRKENQCPQNDHIAEETGLWMGQRVFLGSRKDMEDIAEAMAKIQRNALQLKDKV